MEPNVLRQKFCQTETRRSFLFAGILTSILLLNQFFTLPYMSAVSHLIPVDKVSSLGQKKFGNADSSHEPLSSKEPLSLNALVNSTRNVQLMDKSEVSHGVARFKLNAHLKERASKQEPKFSTVNVEELKDEVEVHQDMDASLDSPLELIDLSDRLSGESGVDINPDRANGISLVNLSTATDGSNQVHVRVDNGTAAGKLRTWLNCVFLRDQFSSSSSESSRSMQDSLKAKPSNSCIDVGSETFTKGTLSGSARKELKQNVSATLSPNSSLVGIRLIKRKKGGLPRISVSEMNHILLQSRFSAHLKPPRSSARIKDLLFAKAQIENAAIVKNDPLLYSSVFRNVSQFKRSYELMERKLKVYVYKDGKKPIFHQPLLFGIYASEGWFMKLMEKSKHFVVKDPRRAHLFYLPFSTRMLQFTLYKPRSHSRRDLAEYLKNYVNKIAGKYPFWNRTGGADHFLAACHDWASYETRPHMESTIRALCNADLSGGFKLGKDVSLPETYVRSSKNPLRDLGGNPADRRPTLAFYAGGVHGYLRQSLLLHWENKDPDMKIFGPKFYAIGTKILYIEHMKSSKYCICPRGYEVNSPRIVEAIFYECVPVIISDNFVPPFFEVLDWEAFAVFVAEKDIAKLKDILLTISEDRYLTMQMRVKAVQRHFLWHADPVKYDLFHMILHSVWLNRLYQIGIS